MKSVIRTLLFATILTCFLSASCKVQAQDSAAIEGIWKGTSICHQKNSPCHDEVVVYHISKAAAAGVYTILANKIVNGVEEEMGTLDFVYDAAKQTLTCHMTDKQQRKSIWLFYINGNKITGTLRLEKDNKLYRKIEVTKQ